MCGIGGVLRFDQTAVSESGLAAMALAMAHRGPDGQGMWISPARRVGLVHRRLAIVDLSSSAAQPMGEPQGRVWLTYNGEIYNHAALRAELIARGHQFITHHSDSEVILHGYLAWGLDGVLARLEGMFAFAIWDKERNLLALARDRVGIKPLYFHSTPLGFWFASEIKSLLTQPELSRELEPAALYHYLTMMVTPAPLTLFRGVFKLPAATRLIVRADGTLEGKTYWTPWSGVNPIGASASPQEREAAWVEGIRERLVGAVNRQMVADVPVGVLLSGGIDSTTLLALMSRAAGGSPRFRWGSPTISGSTSWSGRRGRRGSSEPNTRW